MSRRSSSFPAGDVDGGDSCNALQRCDTEYSTVSHAMIAVNANAMQMQCKCNDDYVAYHRGTVKFSHVCTCAVLYVQKEARRREGTKVRRHPTEY